MISSKESIDVIIPVHNGEAFLKQAIHSVTQQSLRPHKIIIVDDGSTDGTEQVVKEAICNSTIPIKYIYQQNKGVSFARNKGISNSCNEFIAFLDADDSWKSTKLEKQMMVFHKDVSCRTGVVYSDIQPIDESGKQISRAPVDYLDRSLKGNVFTRLVNANISSSASGVLIRRNCFNTVGLFDVRLKTCEDWDMWLRIAEKYDFEYVDEKLVNIRIHGDNTSKNVYAMVLGRIEVLNKLYTRSEHDPVIFNELSYNVIRLVAYSFPSWQALNDIRRILSSETRYKIFTNATGLLEATRKGLHKLLKKQFCG